MAKTKKTKKESTMTKAVLEFDSMKVVQDIIKSLVREERQRSFACERSRIDELDKAICSLQKDMRSMKVTINRLDS